MAVKQRRWRFHGLKRPKIRQDWNKYNLYNLAHLKGPVAVGRTFFQQKWTAKATTRAYHGEQILEKHWKRMFSKIMPAVVPMNPGALAENDGSNQSSGRGSGRIREHDSSRRIRPPNPTPYAQMVYYPTERRLDTAIFRALFASSVRQARQHVVHGHVKVNGKKMIYPGYLLNPGDLFSVTPVRVLKTTGVFQDRWNFYAAARKRTVEMLEEKGFFATENATKKEQEEDQDLTEEDEQLTEEESHIPTSDETLATTKKALLNLREQASDLLAEPPAGKRLSARQKQDLRAFKKTLKHSLSRAAGLSPSTLDDLESEFQTISSRVAAAGENEQPTTSEAALKASSPKSQTAELTATQKPIASEEPPSRERSLFPWKHRPWWEKRGDRSRRWRPKDFMPAFAFVPRYLEVHYGICSAVYLRDPVCKPGYSEVPTPFHPETGRLSFNWYLRRR